MLWLPLQPKPHRNGIFELVLDVQHSCCIHHAILKHERLRNWCFTYFLTDPWIIWLRFLQKSFAIVLSAKYVVPRISDDCRPRSPVLSPLFLRSTQQSVLLESC